MPNVYISVFSKMESRGRLFQLFELIVGMKIYRTHLWKLSHNARMFYKTALHTLTLSLFDCQLQAHLVHNIIKSNLFIADSTSGN